MTDHDGSAKSRREWKGMRGGGGGGGGAVYGLGFIGALIYFWGEAIGFGAFVTGFLKALAWPAFLVYHLMQFLRM